MTAKKICRNGIILLRKRISILRLNLRKRRTREKKRKRWKISTLLNAWYVTAQERSLSSIQKIRTASEINPLTLYMSVLIHFLREMRDKRTTISPDHCITKLSNFYRAWVVARVLILMIFRKVCASVANEIITDAKIRKKKQCTVIRRWNFCVKLGRSLSNYLNPKSMRNQPQKKKNRKKFSTNVRYRFALIFVSLVERYNMIDLLQRNSENWETVGKFTRFLR